MYSHYGEEFGLGGSRWSRLPRGVRLLAAIGAPLVLLVVIVGVAWATFGSRGAQPSAASGSAAAPTTLPLPWRYSLANVTTRAEAGKQIVVTTVQIGNFSEKRGQADRAQMVIRDGQGRTYSPDLTRSQAQPGALQPLFESLAPGQTTQVALTFVLPADATGLVLVIRPLDGSTSTELSLPIQA